MQLLACPRQACCMAMQPSPSYAVSYKRCGPGLDLDLLLKFWRVHSLRNLRMQAQSANPGNGWASLTGDNFTAQHQPASIDFAAFHYWPDLWVKLRPACLFHCHGDWA